jgi:hypothetical protein
MHAATVITVDKIKNPAISATITITSIPLPKAHDTIQVAYIYNTRT